MSAPNSQLAGGGVASALADAGGDERRLDHLERLVAVADHDADRAASADRGRAAPARCPAARVGENVPEVTSPTGLAVGVDDLHVRPRDAASGRLQPAQQPGGACRPFGPQRVRAPERGLVPADRPRSARLHRGDVGRQVLAVQRVAHLGAQGVARAQPAGRMSYSAPRPAPRPRRAGGSGRHHQFVAALTGVAGPADGQRGAAPARRSRRPCSRGRPAGRARPGSRPRAGPGRRSPRGRRARCATSMPVGRRRSQRRDDVGGVRGVRDEEHLVVAEPVGDQVVDHTAGRRCTAGCTGPGRRRSGPGRW